MCSRFNRRFLSTGRGFSLVELLVVLAVIALLIGILLPTLAAARRATMRAGCGANLRNLGVIIEGYQQEHGNVYPVARYMPPPMVSSDADPPLPEVLGQAIVGSEKVFRCPSDGVLFAATTPGSSYVYNIGLSGKAPDDTWFVKELGFDLSQVPVLYDCDNFVAEFEGGTQLEVAAFHINRNQLFADGHVGDFE